MVLDMPCDDPVFRILGAVSPGAEVAAELGG